MYRLIGLKKLSPENTLLCSVKLVCIPESFPRPCSKRNDELPTAFYCRMVQTQMLSFSQLVDLSSEAGHELRTKAGCLALFL